jgi:hypothetical protein
MDTTKLPIKLYILKAFKIDSLSELTFGRIKSEDK